MTTSSTFSPITGGLGHLRLHSPTRPCPFEKTEKQSSAKMEHLMLAFEHATGWQMGYQETPKSRRKRQAADDPTLPIAGQLSIEDLSQLHPAGVPAASRIYCEKLVDEFNLVVAELDRCRMELHELRIAAASKQPGHSRQPADNESRIATPNMRARNNSRIANGKSKTKSMKSKSGEFFDSLVEPPPANLPLTSHSVNIVPLGQPQQSAVFEWFVEPTGLTRFAVITCDQKSTNRTSELIAARATFLTECRHRTCDETIQYELQSVVERLFPGDANVRALCGSVNSMTGDLTLAGCKQFLVTSPGHIDGLNEVPDATVLKTYLPHGQHLMISGWPKLGCQLTQEWLSTTTNKLRTIDPLSLSELFSHQITNAIPRLPSDPEIAIAITRV